MVAVDRDICSNCNDYIVRFPKSFHIRIYDNSLSCRTHNVIRYTTKFANVFTYSVMRSSYIVTVWTDSDVIVGRYERQGIHRVMRFTPDTHIKNIVCSLISEKNRWAVPDNEPCSIEVPLF